MYDGLTHHDLLLRLDALLQFLSAPKAAVQVRRELDSIHRNFLDKVQTGEITIEELYSASHNRQNPIHERLLALVTLANREPMMAVDMLASIVVDTSEKTKMRAVAAITLPSIQFAPNLAAVLSRLIENRTLSAAYAGHFDGTKDGTLQRKTLRAILLEGVRLSIGLKQITDEIMSNPARFPNAWLDVISYEWGELFYASSWASDMAAPLLIAARVARNKDTPDALRIQALEFLLVARRMCKRVGYRFPVAVWDDIRWVWLNSGGGIKGTAEEILKLQGLPGQ